MLSWSLDEASFICLKQIKTGVPRCSEWVTPVSFDLKMISFSASWETLTFSKWPLVWHLLGRCYLRDTMRNKRSDLNWREHIIYGWRTHKISNSLRVKSLEDFTREILTWRPVVHITFASTSKNFSTNCHIRQRPFWKSGSSGLPIVAWNQSNRLLIL